MGTGEFRTRAAGRGQATSTANAPVILMLFLAALAGQAEAQAPVAPDAAHAKPYQIRVNVDLVVLHATVRDRKGRFASDLREQDFEIYEDGVRQSLRLFRHEDVPVTVGLVVDHSGSMRPKLQDVVAAARTFVESSSTEDEMFVVNFNEHVTWGLPEGVRLTNHPDQLARAIFNTPVTGETALYDAVAKAQEGLQAGNRDKKVLVVISDGGDNASTHSLADVLKMAEQSSALIYTVGIFDEDNNDRNPKVLKRLARATGGEALFPERPSDVIAACERIARDIRHQYTLGYVSTNAAQPGSRRTIRVVAHSSQNSQLVVRTRSGYIAADESNSEKDQGAE